MQAKNEAYDQILIDWIVMFQFWKKKYHASILGKKPQNKQTQ